MVDDPLAPLDSGFRTRYLDHAELTAQLQRWASAFPELAKLEAIGRTPEGRELWLLTVGPAPERRRPATWIDGNMHASELAGSAVALALAEDALRLHLQPDAPLHGLSEPERAALRDGLVYVLPRMSPDGAEQVLRTGQWVRSVPRDARPGRERPRWIARDLDGDGRALLMRVVDASGEYVESREHPGLMVPRVPSDDGPFYKIYPEGEIERWDGLGVPDPDFLDDNWPDLNRNFPYSWTHEPHQVGAGRFATSEPEARAVVEWIEQHPEVFTWLNLHTFGGVYIRPLGDASDDTMDAQDLAVFRQTQAFTDTHTPYPMVSGGEEFTYEPGKPLRGDLTEYAYHQRGAVAMVCELWDLFKRLDMPRTRKFVDFYNRVERAEMERFGAWNRAHNRGRALQPWVAIQHPQLGAAEVGGLDARWGLWNPPVELLPEICAQQAAAWLRIAALQPRMALGPAQVRSVGGAGDEQVRLVEVEIRNLGYLPTYGLHSAKQLPWNLGLSASVTVEGGLVDPSTPSVQPLGHLEGWGRGLQSGSTAPYYQRSRGSVSTARARWLVRGGHGATIRVEAPRVGELNTTVRWDETP
jgi:hypothetical protein